MIVEELKKSILNYAIIGLLSKQNNDEKCNIEVETINNSELFNIPNNWKWLKVKDVGDLVRGNGIKRTETTDIGIQCIRYGEIYTNYSYSFKNSISFVSDKLANNCKNVKTGDILLTLTGENEYDIAKATAYLGENRLVAGGDLAIFTNHHQNPLYLSYYFASPFAIKQKANTAKGNIIVHTSTDKIGDYFIPVPPIEEQQRIVDKVEELFAKLEELKTIEGELELLKNNFPSDMRNSILNFVFAKYNENTIELSNISDINGGYAFKSNEYIEKGIRVIRISDFNQNGIEEKNAVYSKYDPILEQYKLSEGNIIMCMTGGTVGKNLLLENIPSNYYTNQRVATIKVNASFVPKFVYFCINTPLIQSMIQKNKNSTNDNISMNLIKSFPIPDISLEEQQRIVDKLEQLLPLCDDIEKLIN